MAYMLLSQGILGGVESQSGSLLFKPLTKVCSPPCPSGDKEHPGLLGRLACGQGPL